VTQVLLVIDVQHGMFTINEPVYRGAELLQTLQNLMERARTAGVEVIFVRHEGGPGHLLERGKPEWAIHPEIAPLAGELVVDKNRPDSFFETVLQEDLQARRAFSLGYDVTFVADGHSTWDSEFVTAQQKIDHHTDLMLRFADVKRAEEIEFFGE
jgi:nicotinamidase-related amidase